jgi:hypothetical protein
MYLYSEECLDTSKIIFNTHYSFLYFYTKKLDYWIVFENPEKSIFNFATRKEIHGTWSYAEDRSCFFWLFEIAYIRIPSLAIARSSDRFLWRGALARKRDSIPFVSCSVLIAFTRVHTNSLYYYFASCISVHTACMHMHRASHGFAFNEPTFQHSFISCCMHTHSISLFFFSTRQTLNSLFTIPFWFFFSYGNSDLMGSFCNSLFRASGF